MRVCLALASATLLVIALSVLSAQTRSPLEAGCKIIDDTRPAVQLSFAVPRMSSRNMDWWV